MQLDLLLTAPAPIDTPRPGDRAVRAKRSDAAQPPHRKAAGEARGAFDTVLEKARWRQTAAAYRSSENPVGDAAGKSEACPRTCRSGSPGPAEPSADDGTVQGPPLSRADGTQAGSTAPSPDGAAAAVALIPDVVPGSELPVGLFAAQPTPDPTGSAHGDRPETDSTTGAAEAPALPSGDVLSTVSQPILEEEGRAASEPAQTGDKTGKPPVADAGRADVQVPPAKAQAAVTLVGAYAADVAVTAEAARSEKNRHQSPTGNGTDRITDKKGGLEPFPSGRGESFTASGAGGRPSVFTGSPAGDGPVTKFGNGPDRDLETGCSAPRSSEKGAEKPSESLSVLKAQAGGYQEGTAATAARSGSESDHKLTQMSLFPQRAENAAGATTATTETGEAHFPKDQRAETLNQIVDKAVFRLRNGHSEVRIDLKPDALGHVRLQIVTENHQVTLRIMAESRAAKDLIDSGIGQLKADLQAQGLRVDELEVSVANEFSDFNRHSDLAGRTPQSRRTPSADRPAFQDSVPAAGLAAALENRPAAGVDCFV